MILPSRLNHWISCDFEYAPMYSDNEPQFVLILRIAPNLAALHRSWQSTAKIERETKIFKINSILQWTREIVQMLTWFNRATVMSELPRSK